MFWAVCVALGLLTGVASAAEGEARLNQKAPIFFLSTYNPEKCGEQRVFLDKLVGEKLEGRRQVLLLNFFSIDCKPCRKELPLLQKVFEKYKHKGLSILVVNTDGQEDKIHEMLAYIREAGFSFPVLKDRFQALQRRYGVDTFPSTFLVDADGVIREIRVGFDKDQPLPLTAIQQRLGVPVEAVVLEEPAPDSKGKEAKPQ